MNSFWLILTLTLQVRSLSSATLSTSKQKELEGSPRSVVANVLESESIVNEFELRSRYFLHFRIINPAIG